MEKPMGYDKTERGQPLTVEDLDRAIASVKDVISYHVREWRDRGHPEGFISIAVEKRPCLAAYMRELQDLQHMRSNVRAKVDALHSLYD